jgi:hypothetical protein
MNDKEALKLAKILENIEDYKITMTAAHEIRRLHFENKELKEALETARADEREACIKACKKLLKVFLSSQYKTGQPLSSFGERHAVASCVEAIEARGTI